MISGKRGAGCHRVLGVVAYASGAGMVFVAACLKADAERLSGKWAVVGEGIAWIQGWAWLLVVLLPATVVICRRARRFIAKSWTSGVQEVLAQVQRRAFRNVEADPPHEHRVTLFKRTRRLKDLFRERLVIVERSSRLTRKHTTKFRVSDDPAKCQGIAGATWVKQNVLYIDHLPQISRSSMPQDKAKYAKMTYVSEEWIGQRLGRGDPFARSYLGIPVEVKGKPWGVLVLDSLKTDVIRRRIQHYFDLASLSLGKLLERS